jgi:hypothetical protein
MTVSKNKRTFSTFVSVMRYTFMNSKKELFHIIMAFALVLLATPIKAEEPLRFVHVLTVYKTNLIDGTDLLQPESVFCKDNTIIVADTGHGQLVRYTLNKEDLSAGEDIKLPKDSHPIQVKLNSKDEIFVLDGKLRQIMQITPKGNSLGIIKPEGTPKADSIFIRAFTLDSEDNLYLLDLFGQRLIIADSNKQYVREIPLPQDGQAFSDVAVDEKGKIYLLDSIAAAVYTAAKGKDEFSLMTKNLKQFATFPVSLTPDGRGGLFLVDSHGNGIIVVGPDGSYRGRHLTMGWKPGLVYYPSEMCLTPNDEAVIADRDNNRIQIFKLIR